MASLNDQNQKISIFNFDPVEQNKLWLQLGPARARKLLVGVLRTALLLGKSVELDRNQVFEGVFFTSMTPDKLRWHLGLEPDSAIPLSIRLLPTKVIAPLAPGPWQLSKDGMAWGVDLEVEKCIRANLLAVQNTDRASSPLIALTDGKYDGSSIHESASEHSSSGATSTDKYKLSDVTVMPQHIWKQYDLEVARDLRDKARESWMLEMLSGRIAVRTPEEFEEDIRGIGPALELNPKPNTDNRTVKQLVELLMKLEYTDEAKRKASIQCTTTHSGLDCKLHHVTTRSLITRWLDGETIKEFSIEHLPVNLRGAEFVAHRSAALAWWTKAYYSWITSRDKTTLLTLSGVLQSPTGFPEGQAQEEERAWQLIPTKVGFWKRIGKVMSSRYKSSASKNLTLGGQVVDELASFTPEQYSRVRAALESRTERQRTTKWNNSLNELSLAVIEHGHDETPRKTKINRAIFRTLLLTSLAALIFLIEEGIIRLPGSGWFVVALVLSGLTAIPWGEFAALTRMYDSSKLLQIEKAQ
jgi:hypothetical protein